MPLFNLPFSVEIPAQLGDNRLIFLVSENIHAIGKECVSAPHEHGHFELRYIVSGTGNQIINETEILTSAGDILLLRPTEYHYQTEDKTDDSLEQYSLGFAVKEPSTHASSVQKEQYHKLIELLQSIRLLKDKSLSLLPSFRLLESEIHARNIGYFNYLQSTCTAILIELIRLSECTENTLFQPEISKGSIYWREQIGRFMRQSFMEDVTLKDFAHAMKVSERQATRLVMREFGIGYAEKLNECRIRQAQYLLRHSDKSLQEICISCGFRNYSYFSACFKKHVGVTPSKYRNCKI